MKYSQMTNPDIIERIAKICFKDTGKSISILLFRAELYKNIEILNQEIDKSNQLNLSKEEQEERIESIMDTNVPYAMPNLEFTLDDFKSENSRTTSQNPTDWLSGNEILSFVMWCQENKQ